MSESQREKARKHARDYQRRRRAAMNEQDKKAESERVMTIQRRDGPRPWVYEPTPEKLEAARERVRKWNQEHPEAGRDKSARRRAKEVQGYVDREWMRILMGDICSYCGTSGGHIDHIDPLAGTGNHEDINLTSACRRCNSSKGAKPLLKFLLSV